MNKERYIGVMSGTSLDGVDVVLCEVDVDDCQLLASFEYPMPLSLKEDILKIIQHKNYLEEIGRIDHRLGKLFAKAIESFIEDENIDTSNIVAIGLHGQTLWHQPEEKHGFSMQFGDPNIVTTQINIPVVADFRRKDVALGGQGAPFAPAFHAFLFGQKEKSVGIVNIGGMANITILDTPLIGYDTGCGNVLLDMWIAKHHNLSYDKEGLWAKSGTVDEILLESMLKDSYFKQAYPKSTGRETFNEAWLYSYIKEKTYKPEDVQRTLLELTARSISQELLSFNREKILLCGGGAKNSFLVERINAHMPNTEVLIAQNADMIEAMTFAWLAYKRIHKENVALKEVTGASKNALLGAVYA